MGAEVSAVARERHPARGWPEDAGQRTPARGRRGAARKCGEVGYEEAHVGPCRGGITFYPMMVVCILACCTGCEGAVAVGERGALVEEIQSDRRGLRDRSRIAGVSTKPDSVGHKCGCVAR